MLPVARHLQQRRMVRRDTLRHQAAHLQRHIPRQPVEHRSIRLAVRVLLGIRRTHIVQAAAVAVREMHTVAAGFLRILLFPIQRLISRAAQDLFFRQTVRHAAEHKLRMPAEPLAGIYAAARCDGRESAKAGEEGADMPFAVETALCHSVQRGHAGLRHVLSVSLQRIQKDTRHVVHCHGMYTRLAPQRAHRAVQGVRKANQGRLPGIMPEHARGLARRKVRQRADAA